jgi:membrane protein YqaA with SNARE-associated domain
MRQFLEQIAATLYAYGPLGVLLLSAGDSMGIPLPAAVDVMVIGIAVKSASTPWHAWYTALMATVGSIGGNVLLFQAARHGRRLFKKDEETPGERRHFREWFHQYGLLTVFIPAITPVIPLPLKVFVISAGALHTPFLKFLGVIVVARVLRYFGMTWVALRLGEDAPGFFQRNGWSLGAAALALAVALYWLIRINARRSA